MGIFPRPDAPILMFTTTPRAGALRRLLSSIALSSLAILPLAAATIPAVGEKAPGFTLPTLAGQPVQLDALTAEGPVVLIVLRGWPGYQCPLCTRQVQEFIAARADFAAAGARVLFVYPGPADGLQAHAEEFKALRGDEWPEDYRFALDPDYRFTGAYGLRWDAPNETAYPSTFIIDGAGMVRFAKVSRTHGDRSGAAAVVAELKRLAPVR